MPPVHPSDRSPLAIPDQDLKRCHDSVGLARWQRLAGLRVFVTGGTGFVGKWLLATLLDADEQLGLGCRITVLSRNPGAFERCWPAIRGRVHWLAGDVRDFDIAPERQDVIIHAATDVVRVVPPDELLLTCIDGTRRVIELAHRSEAGRLLLISSGAVYGQLPSEMKQVAETYRGAPDVLQTQAAYGEGKRVSEWLVAQGAARLGYSGRIARLFAAVGPHYPLDQHFAIGNFIADALANRPIRLKGDGRPVRSYLYAADMAAWLWAILLEEKPPRQAYNVGSAQSLSIAELAQLVQHTIANATTPTTSPQTLAAAPPRALGANHYVPDNRAALQDLCLPTPLELAEAITRTARWHAQHGPKPET